MTLRRSPIKRTSWIKRGTKPLPKVNPRQQARRKAAYTAYLRSPAWTALKKAVHARAKSRCEMRLAVGGGRCPETTHLQVHHKTYARFTAELLTDLILVCKGHHEAIHAAQGKRRSA